MINSKLWNIKFIHRKARQSCLLLSFPFFSFLCVEDVIHLNFQMDTLCESTGLKKLNKVAVLKGWRNIRISKRKVGGWRAMDTGLTLFSYTKLTLFFLFYDVKGRYETILKYLKEIWNGIQNDETKYNGLSSKLVYRHIEILKSPSINLLGFSILLKIRCIHL